MYDMGAEKNNDKLHWYTIYCNHPDRLLLPDRETKTPTVQKDICDVETEINSNDYGIHDPNQLQLLPNLQSKNVTDEEAHIYHIESEMNSVNLYIHEDQCSEQLRPLPNAEPKTPTAKKTLVFSTLSQIFTEKMNCESELPAHSSSICTASNTSNFKANQAIGSASPFLFSYSTRMCKFPSCNNRYVWRSNTNMKFHRFPSNSLQRGLWHLACDIEQNVNSKHFYVCEDHFDDSDYIGNGKNRMLKRTAVPRNIATDVSKSNGVPDGTNSNYVSRTSSPIETESLNCKTEFPEQLFSLYEVSKCTSNHLNANEKSTVTHSSTERINCDLELPAYSPNSTAPKITSYSKADQGICSTGSSSRYSTRTCKFPSCNNRYFWKGNMNIRFHRFPREPVQRKLWHWACNIDENVNSKNFYVCGDHFDDSDYNGKGRIGRLKPRAEPKNIVTDLSESKLFSEKMLLADETNINNVYHTSSSIKTESLNYETEFLEQSTFLPNEVFKCESDNVSADERSSSDVLQSSCDSGSIRQLELLQSSYDDVLPNVKVEDSPNKHFPRYSTRTCKFPSCENKFFWMSSENKKFHSFPQKSLGNSWQKQLWHTVCGLPLDINSSNYFICEDHFYDSDYNQGVKKGRLRHDAVPKDIKSVMNSVLHDHSY